jgi:2-amino-4-hydroxy-6-hydroxymethyldihydropteridine diphosphokinase
VSEAFVAIGSNLDAMTHLLAAARALKGRYPDARFSRCYRNRAVGFEGPDFINAVTAFSTDQPVPALLAALREIELACGRGLEQQRWGPRGMDLDLLLYDDRVEEGPGYRLPRPDLRLRAYMLGPLAELAPQHRYPPSGPTLEQLWQRFPRAEHPLEPVALDLNAV